MSEVIDTTHWGGRDRIANLEQNIAALQNAGSLTAGATVTDGTQATSFKLSATHQTASGGMGLHLSRDVTGRSLMLSLESGGSVVWETTALDATTTDLILAYDPGHGDQLRVRKGMHILVDLLAGQPSQTHRLQLSSQATGEDAALRNLLYFSATTGSGLTAYARGALDGTENFQVATSGAIGAGKTLSGYVTGASEFTPGLVAQKADGVAFFRVRRDGTSTQQWEFRVQSASSNRLELADVTGGTVPFSIGTGSTAGSITITSAGVNLGPSGGKVGFYGVTPISRAVLATGASHTVDDVITALQNLGLVSQS